MYEPPPLVAGSPVAHALHDVLSGLQVTELLDNDDTAIVELAKHLLARTSAAVTIVADDIRQTRMRPSLETLPGRLKLSGTRSVAHAKAYTSFAAMSLITIEVVPANNSAAVVWMASEVYHQQVIFVVSESGLKSQYRPTPALVREMPLDVALAVI